MMNKKAKIGDIIMDNIIYLILLIIFFVGMTMFVYSKMNGAPILEDYYAKEIVKVIESSRPGDEIRLDVQKATELAKKNQIGNEEIFSFDNFKNEACVKLSKGRASCYSYFNSVNVAPSGSKWVYSGATAGPVNRLHLLVFSKEKAK